MTKPRKGTTARGARAMSDIKLPICERLAFRKEKGSIAGLYKDDKGRYVSFDDYRMFQGAAFDHIKEYKQRAKKAESEREEFKARVEELESFLEDRYSGNWSNWQCDLEDWREAKSNS